MFDPIICFIIVRKTIIDPRQIRYDSMQLLRDFELLLVHKHRFALSDVVLCMQRVVHDLQLVRHALTVVSSSSLVPDKKSADPLERISRCLERLVALVPSFLGERELATLVAALQEFGRLVQALETHPKLQQAMHTLSGHAKALADAVTRDAAVCALLTKKRDVGEEFSVGFSWLLW